MFQNRQEAGQKLAEEIKQLSPDRENSVILALPRGGVIVAAEIARVLNLPLDILVVRKIGSPQNPEYAIGAVAENSLVMGAEKISEKYLEEEIENQRKEIRRRIKAYRGKRKPLNLKNKNIILVDDGLATGLTMKVAIEEVKKKKPAKIILAVPVAPPETIEKFKKETDQVISLATPSPFFAISNFYTNFPQITDEEVRATLGRNFYFERMK